MHRTARTILASTAGASVALAAASLSVVPAAGAEVPTFRPGSGPLGTTVTVAGLCPDEGLGDVLRVVVGFYYDDAWFSIPGHSLFHSAEVAADGTGAYEAKLKVGPAVKYIQQTSPGMPGDEVLRKPKAGDRLFVEAKCYYEGSAFPFYESAAKPFSVTAALVSTSSPTISGTPRVGKTLTASKGGWKPKPASVAYQWLRGGKAIKGADRSSYRVVSKDKGTTVAVRVTAKKPGYPAAKATSKALRIR